MEEVSPKLQRRLQTSRAAVYRKIEKQDYRVENTEWSPVEMGL